MVELKKISEFVWEIPKTGDMKVPGRIFASEKLIENIKKDRTLEQVRNVAKLPGILGASFATMDAHQGYGFPIGGVAAFDLDEGVVCPGGVGYDINCSVRLLKTNLKREDLKKAHNGVPSKLGTDVPSLSGKIVHSLFRMVPTGIGNRGLVKLSDKELKEVLIGGAQWAVDNDYGIEDDWKHTEEDGKMDGAEPEFVSGKAKGRGINQLGSLGAGNHFLEVQVVDEIINEKIAGVFGLEKGMITIMVHCGSRGLGHQIAGDYIKLMEKEYGVPDFDKELVNAPIKSELGKKYLGAMKCAANFAFANKQVITHFIRENMKHYFPDFKADVVYDVCHNIAKVEEHNGKDLLIMRKGATRSFGPGRKEVPEDYREVGQPVLLPGSMGTASYVLVGTKEAEEISFGSTSHGAGRVESRTSARNRLKGEDVKKGLKEKGIQLETGNVRGVSEEAPEVYKDVDEVVRVSNELGIGDIVARLKPLGVIKG